MSKDGLDRRFGYILNLSFFLNLDIFLILPKKKQSFGGLPVPINLLIKSELKTQFLTTYVYTCSLTTYNQPSKLKTEVKLVQSLIPFSSNATTLTARAQAYFVLSLIYQHDSQYQALQIDLVSNLTPHMYICTFMNLFGMNFCFMDL